jgi:hypothetical protein
MVAAWEFALIMGSIYIPVASIRGSENIEQGKKE